MKLIRVTARRRLVPILALGLLVAACGSDDVTTDSPVATEASAPTDVPAETEAPVVAEPPVETDAAAESDAPVATDAPVVTEAPGEPDAVPQRIVSLSPTHTEMLFAIGAGGQLVAVDEFSDHPEEALDLPNELSGFEPNVEAIAEFAPDLVVVSGTPAGFTDQLADLGIEFYDAPAAATLDDAFSQIEELGALTGHVAEAEQVARDLRARVDEILAATPRPDEPLTVYHELDPTFFSADSTTFIGEIYSLLGLRNIADRAEGESFGFPQLNPEFLVSADPDLIFLADTKCCGVTAESVAERPGFDAITAVREGNVIEMDDDIASRWGPRIVDYLDEVSKAIQRASVPA